MGSVLGLVLIVFMVISGGLTSVYLGISFVTIIIWKIYRKIKFGYSLYD